MIDVEVLEPKNVSETIMELGEGHPEPAVWLPGGAHVAVICVGSQSSEREWVIVVNRKTRERVKLTL